MSRESNAQAIVEILQKYIQPDCLYPQFDGMSIYEIAHMIIDVVDY